MHINCPHWRPFANCSGLCSHEWRREKPRVRYAICLRVCPHHTATPQELADFEEWKEDRDEIIEAQNHSGCGCKGKR